MIAQFDKHISDFSLLPRKTNIAPEKWRSENYVPFREVYFSETMLNFLRVRGWFNHQIGEDFFIKICLDYASCNIAVAKIYG